MPQIVNKILGVIIGFYAFSFWFGYIFYLRNNTSITSATAFQMLILTLTSMAFFMHASLWILPLGVIFWLICSFFWALLLRFLGIELTRKTFYLVPLSYAIILGWDIAKNNKYNLGITLLLSVLVVLFLIFICRVLGIIFYEPK